MVNASVADAGVVVIDTNVLVLTILLIAVFCVLLGVLVYMMTRDDDDDDYHYCGGSYSPSRSIVYSSISSITTVGDKEKEVDPNDL